MVVLRRDHYEGVNHAKALAQRRRTLYGLASGFRQLDCGIHDLDLEFFAACNLFSGPCGHLVAESARAAAAINECNFDFSSMTSTPFEFAFELEEAYNLKLT